MNASKVARALAVLGCLGMLLPGAAMSAGFGEPAGGVNMTAAAKDVNDIKQSNSGHAPQKKQPAVQKSAKKHPAKKQPAKKQPQHRADPQDDRVRGG